ncbi:zinc finger protein 771-like [Thrips palmi]|uniref:Zinc finger protein 771-like n=1 Tax=Thrips palmi TaxID=161013 RepID=A0A6P8ZZM4_THRPL|nr:zinc finger protein 771-like [Thrips palmi]
MRRRHGAIVTPAGVSLPGGDAEDGGYITCTGGTPTCPSSVPRHAVSASCDRRDSCAIRVLSKVPACLTAWLAVGADPDEDPDAAGLFPEALPTAQTSERRRQTTTAPSSHAANAAHAVRCEGCGRVYNHRASYYCHRKYECGKEPQFQCPYCPHRSKRIGNLKKHVVTLHPGQLPWKPEPDWHFRARPRQPRHLYQYVESRLRIKLCLASPPVGSTGSTGSANKDARPTLCVCGRWFRYRSSLYRHLKYECGKEPAFQCHLCTFRTKRLLGGRRRSNRGAASARSHRSKDARPAVCICGCSFQYRSSMYRHIKYECGKEPQFQCPYCPLRSKRASNLKKHVLTLHPEQPQLAPDYQAWPAQALN